MKDVNLLVTNTKITGVMMGNSLKGVLSRIRMKIIDEIVELNNKIKHNEVKGFLIIKQIKQWNYKRSIKKREKWLGIYK